MKESLCRSVGNGNITGTLDGWANRQSSYERAWYVGLVCVPVCGSLKRTSEIK